MYVHKLIKMPHSCWKRRFSTKSPLSGRNLALRNLNITLYHLLVFSLYRTANGITASGLRARCASQQSTAAKCCRSLPVAACRTFAQRTLQNRHAFVRALVCHLIGCRYGGMGAGCTNKRHALLWKAVQQLAAVNQHPRMVATNGLFVSGRVPPATDR